jgi:TfoX/Sxy family transcriptional regulator of competence genes
LAIGVYRQSITRIQAMAYDEELAARIRELVSDEPGLEEKKMFGGLGFLVQGNMAVAASGQGGLLVRVDPNESDALVSSSNAYPMEMRGREMTGWLRVDTEDVQSPDELRGWVERGVSYARSLPAK